MFCFYRSHSAKEPRHRPRAHLVIGNFAIGKSLDERFDLLGGQFAAVALFLDQARDVHVDKNEQPAGHGCANSKNSPSDAAMSENADLVPRSRDSRLCITSNGTCSRV